MLGKSSPTTPTLVPASRPYDTIFPQPINNSQQSNHHQRVPVKPIPFAYRDDPWSTDEEDGRVVGRSFQSGYSSNDDGSVVMGEGEAKWVASQYAEGNQLLNSLHAIRISRSRSAESMSSVGTGIQPHGFHDQNRSVFHPSLQGPGNHSSVAMTTNQTNLTSSTPSDTSTMLAPTQSLSQPSLAHVSSSSSSSPHLRSASNMDPPIIRPLQPFVFRNTPTKPPPPALRSLSTSSSSSASSSATSTANSTHPPVPSLLHPFNASHTAPLPTNSTLSSTSFAHPLPHSSSPWPTPDRPTRSHLHSPFLTPNGASSSSSTLVLSSSSSTTTTPSSSEPSFSSTYSSSSQLFPPLRPLPMSFSSLPQRPRPFTSAYASPRPFFRVQPGSPYVDITTERRKRRRRRQHAAQRMMKMTTGRDNNGRSSSGGSTTQEGEGTDRQNGKDNTYDDGVVKAKDGNHTIDEGKEESDNTIDYIYEGTEGDDEGDDEEASRYPQSHWGRKLEVEGGSLTALQQLQHERMNRGRWTTGGGGRLEDSEEPMMMQGPSSYKDHWRERGKEMKSVIDGNSSGLSNHGREEGRMDGHSESGNGSGIGSNLTSSRKGIRLDVGSLVKSELSVVDEEDTGYVDGSSPSQHLHNIYSSNRSTVRQNGRSNDEGKTSRNEGNSGTKIDRKEEEDVRIGVTRRRDYAFEEEEEQGEEDEEAERRRHDGMLNITNSKGNHDHDNHNVYERGRKSKRRRVTANQGHEEEEGGTEEMKKSNASTEVEEKGVITSQHEGEVNQGSVGDTIGVKRKREEKEGNDDTRPDLETEDESTKQREEGNNKSRRKRVKLTMN